MRVWLSSAPSAGRANEDFVAASPDVVVLLDGAGIPPGAESGCTHGVAWYARRLGAHLLAEAGATPDQPLTAALATAIGQVRTAHQATCDLDHPASPTSTVLAIRRDGADLEYLVLADSVLVFEPVDGDPVVVTDDRLARTSRRLRARMDALPTGTPEHTEAYHAYTQALEERRNVDGGFWVAGPDPAVAEQALTGTMPVTDVRAVALLSDGASRLVDRFHLADWPDVLKLLADEGPGELIRQVRAAEDSDPSGERWPRGKVHDDATAAYCTISA